MLNNTVKPIKTYLFSLSVVIVTAIIASFIVGKIEFSYKVNQFHMPIFDFIAKYLTHLGDGFFVVGLCIIWIIMDKTTGWFLLLSYASSSLITQTLKRTLFADMQRPIAQLDKKIIHLVEGVTIHSENSFPSGHATTVFALCTALVLILDKKWQLLILFMAIVVAFTRVYLLQHFINDIIAGAVIGTCCALIFHHTYYVKRLPTH